MEKIWKDISGYEGSYQVSNYGEVKSFKYNQERILKPTINGSGYYHVILSKKGNRKTCRVHQLVAIAFLDHKPNGHELVINHIDRNKLNNYLNNLELVSQRYNTSCYKEDIGIYWDKHAKKWVAKIRINDKKIYLGVFTDKQDAIDMYQKALNNLHLYQGDAKAFRLSLTDITL